MVVVVVVVVGVAVAVAVGVVVVVVVVGVVVVVVAVVCVVASVGVVIVVFVVSSSNNIYCKLLRRDMHSRETGTRSRSVKRVVAISALSHCWVFTQRPTAYGSELRIGRRSRSFVWYSLGLNPKPLNPSFKPVVKDCFDSLFLSGGFWSHPQLRCASFAWREPHIQSCDLIPRAALAQQVKVESISFHPTECGIALEAACQHASH